MQPRRERGDAVGDGALGQRGMPMPKTSTGAAAASRGSRSVPATRQRRTGSLTTTASAGDARRSSESPGVDDAVLDHRRRRSSPQSQNSRVEVGDVHDRDVVAVGQRVPGVRCSPRARSARCARGRPRAGRARARRPSATPGPGRASCGRCSTTTSSGPRRAAARAAPRAPSPASARCGRGRGRRGRGRAAAAGGSRGRRATNDVVQEPCTCQSRTFTAPLPERHVPADASADELAHGLGHRRGDTVDRQG